MVLSRKTGILTLEKQLEQQELKDIIATREDGFGHRFKTARDEKNLSIEDVARKLHLNKKIILALESEDHTQLPAAAFVCGYIRNYARLLKIQPELLVESYKNDRSDDSLEPEIKITKGIKTPANSMPYDALSAVVMPMIVVFVLLALATGGWEIWLYVSSNYPGSDSSETVELETVVANDSGANDGLANNDAVEVLLLPDLDKPYDPPAEELLEQSSSDSLLTENSQQAKSSLSAEGSLSTESSLPAVGSGSMPAEGSLPAVGSGSMPAEGSLSAEGSLPAEGSVPAEGSLPAEGLTQAGIDIQPVGVVTNQLILEFSGNSWVSIKDANGKILSTGLKKSSQILQLDGEMPYKVFLGDARVVKISFNGKVFDHSKYINWKNVARFNVE